MTYKVEFLNDYGMWIRKSVHRNEDNAAIMAEVVAEAGRDARIVHQGKIIKKLDRVEV